MDILICILVVLLSCDTNSEFEYVKCKTCDDLIVDEINNFRTNLICTKSILTMNPISTSDVILKNQFSNMDHQVMSNSLFITHKSCDLDVTSEERSLDESVRNFIKNCATRAKNLENIKYSWFWNPETRHIHCVYSAEPFGINCIANKVLTDNFSTTFELDNSVNKNIDEYKYYQSNLRYCKQLKKAQSWLKTCSVPTLVRENIQNRINEFRENLVAQNNISNMPHLNWNIELEMVAAEFGKLWEPEFQTSTCISSSQFDNIQLFHLPLFTSVFNYDRYINPVATIISKVRNEIENSTSSGILKPEYFWIYDTSVTDFGCVFQMSARIYANLVCAYSGDLENGLATNFKYGTPCSGCPKLYYCDGTGNNTKLCGKHENDLPYKHFMIYGSLIVIGFMVHCYLRHN